MTGSLRRLAGLALAALIALAACGQDHDDAPPVVTYEMVPVGDPGNASDTTGFGAVPYAYRIGKLAVTIGQYAAFLDAVAATDPNALDNDGSSANRPVSSVTWFNAARFANWMSNGQPTGAQTGATTENGAYALNGATTGNAVARNAVNPNTGGVPSFHIPLENEWYKAAYYDPTRDGGAGGYTLFATRSDAPPDNLIGDAANQANYLTANGDYCVTQSGDYSSSQNYLTDAGAFTGSASFYGTFDQNGSLWEWNDLDGRAHPNRGVRGGAYTSTPPYLQSSYRMGYVPSGANANGGFRLAGPDG